MKLDSNVVDFVNSNFNFIPFDYSYNEMLQLFINSLSDNFIDDKYFRKVCLLRDSILYYDYCSVPYDIRKLEIGFPKQVYNASHAYNAKVNRIKHFIVFNLYLYKNMYFVTLTFNNDNLNKVDSNISKRIKYALSCFESYMYCVDYGSCNNRVHYHCLAFSNDSNIKSIYWNYGFFNIKRCIYINRAIAQYITKYCQHQSKVKKRAYFSNHLFEEHNKFCFNGSVKMGSFLFTKYCNSLGIDFNNFD